MKKRLSQESVKILENILRNDSLSELLPVNLVIDNKIDVDQRLALIDLVASEFAEFGINEESEPNSYGIQLEDIIDFLNRPLLFEQ